MFMGIRSMQDRFLENLGIHVAGNAPTKVMDAAYSAWSRYQQDNPRIKEIGRASCRERV